MDSISFSIPWTQFILKVWWNQAPWGVKSGGTDISQRLRVAPALFYRPWWLLNVLSQARPHWIKTVPAEVNYLQPVLGYRDPSCFSFHWCLQDFIGPVNFKRGAHWRIQGGPRDTRPPQGPNSFIFMQFLFNNLQNDRLTHPLREMVPPQENPGSTTGASLQIMQ